jgi:hypothetical protein
MEPILARREKEYLELGRWVEKYRDSHDNLSIYYEDENVQVFHIHQPRSREEEFREMWEGRDNNAES